MDEGKSLLETIADERSINPVEHLSDEDLGLHIELLLDYLNYNQQGVLMRRFGLRGFEKSILEDVGEGNWPHP